MFGNWDWSFGVGLGVSGGGLKRHPGLSKKTKGTRLKPSHHLFASPTAYRWITVNLFPRWGKKGSPRLSNSPRESNIIFWGDFPWEWGLLQWEVLKIRDQIKAPLLGFDSAAITWVD